MKQYKIQNRSQKNFHSCVPLKEFFSLTVKQNLEPTNPSAKHADWAT